MTPGWWWGNRLVDSSDIHGFVYSGGVMTDVGTFGGTYSSAFLVNSNGQTIGIANTTSDSETHGFIYSGGTLTDLGTFGGIYNFPNAINNLGQVVGESLTGTGEYHAFLWDSGKLTDLNTLLPANSGWELVNALYFNDAGRIVGIGNLAGQSQWFILDLASANKTPVAIAGPDQTVDCAAQVTLDGSRSSDTDNDPIVFEWSSGGSVLGTNSTLTVSLPIGTNIVTLKVTDPCGASAETNVTVIVADTTPHPTAPARQAVTASADSTCQAPIPNLHLASYRHRQLHPKPGTRYYSVPRAGHPRWFGPAHYHADGHRFLRQQLQLRRPVYRCRHHTAGNCQHTGLVHTFCRERLPGSGPNCIAKFCGKRLLHARQPIGQDLRTHPPGQRSGIGSPLDFTHRYGLRPATARPPASPLKLPILPAPTILSRPASMKVSRLMPIARARFQAS